GMVDRLAARLKDQPHNAEGWVRLMRARLVLGDPAAAAGAYHAALAAFRGSPTDQTALRTSAREMGVPGA
ncbi:MAG: c-type cytochrome biogenesis protein CcmI, partial [Caulobacteraceae bacterium]